MLKRKKLRIKGSFGTVSGLLELPGDPLAGIVLAHGAGAGMQHAFMEELAETLYAINFAVLRFQFPYREAGRSRPDSPKIAGETIAAAVESIREQTQLPIFPGGKSYGARMTTTAAAHRLLPGIKGILCFGFPLHPAGLPSLDRGDHLQKVSVPLLFVQGTRDKLADLVLMKKLCAGLPLATLSIVEGADHGFEVLKRSGRTHGEVMAGLGLGTKRFIQMNL